MSCSFNVCFRRLGRALARKSLFSTTREALSSRFRRLNAQVQNSFRVLCRDGENWNGAREGQPDSTGISAHKHIARQLAPLRLAR
jgi:hypothetical protein